MQPSVSRWLHMVLRLCTRHKTRSCQSTRLHLSMSLPLLLFIPERKERKVACWPYKLVQWQNIVTSKKAPPLFTCWTNDDEERMNGLTTESISITDTHYGRHAALMERELEAAVDSMSRDKRNELRRKLDECEMEDEATDVGGEQAQGTESADGETGAV